MSKPHEKLIDRISNDIVKIKEVSNVSNLLYYIKSNIIRAPLEALVTLYLAEAILIFTPFVTNKYFNDNLTIYMIFFTIAVSGIACFLFSAYVTLSILRWAKMQTIHQEASSCYFLYKLIDTSFHRHMRTIHTIGVLSYIFVSIIVALYLSYVVLAHFLNDSEKVKLIFTFIIVGSTLGLIWNIYGYYSDKRVNWYYIFNLPLPIDNDVKQNNICKKIVIEKRKSFLYAIFWAFVSSALIIFGSLLVLLVLKVQLWNPANPTLPSQTYPVASVTDSVPYTEYVSLPVPEGNTNSNVSTLISYSSLVATYLAAFTLYLQQTYYIFFSRKHKSSIIFLSLNNFNDTSALHDLQMKY